MPNTFKYNTSSIESQSLRKGNFYIGTGDVGKGTTDVTGFYNGFPLGTFSYVIVLHRGGNVPTYYRCQDDAELISRTNQIDTSSVRTTKEQCFSYFASQSDKMVVNKNYNNIVTSGLVLNLDASFLPSFPATGDSWFDLSTSVNTGTLVNVPTFNTTGFFDLDGTDDGISILDNNTLDFSGSSATLTSELLINLDVYRSIEFLNAKGQSGLASQNNYNFIITDSWVYFRVGNGTTTINSPFGISPSNLPVGRWGHIVAVLDSTHLRLYLNGTQIGTGTARTIDPVSNNENYFIASTQYPFDGKIALSRLYNRNLSQSEILQNYYGGPIVTLGLTFAIDASSFVSYDRVGTTWSNLSRNTFNGTFQNSPTFSIVNGGIIDFDGTSAWVEIQTYTFGNGNWTCNIWAQGDNVVYSSTGNLISNSSEGPVTNAMGFLSSKIHYRNYDGAWKSNSGNTTLSTGQWYMLTWVNYAGASANLGTMKMFVNGLSDSSVFNSYATNGGPCNAIGRNWFSYFNGRIGLVQFYNVSLTDSQVFENFNAHRSRFDI